MEHFYTREPESYPLTFTRHYHGIFEWVTSSEWPRDANQNLTVSIDLAEQTGWRRGRDVLLGQYRLFVWQLDYRRNWLYCRRVSGVKEESIRKVLYRIQNLLESAARLTIPELKKQYWKLIDGY